MNREITIYDIALALNISPSTVSRALNNSTLISEKTKSRIRTKAIEMGYRQNVYASYLRKRKSNVIMVFVPHINNDSILSALAAIGKMAEESGCPLIINESPY
jgi:LacI family transcriptional regulator